MADYIDAFRDTGTPAPGSLLPCSCCGRTFNVDALPRHLKVCAKQKKRKQFDSSKQRQEGIIVQLGYVKTKDSFALPPKPKSNWKQKHNEFMATIQTARAVTVAEKTGGPLPSPPPLSINPDYVQCPHCSRRFNKHSAERHIGFCKEQKSRIGKSPASASTAAQRMAVRTQYKPPLPGKRTSIGISSSSAGRTRQTPSKVEYKATDYDDHPLPTKTAGSASKMSPVASTSSRRKALSAGTATESKQTPKNSRTERSPLSSSSTGSRSKHTIDTSNGSTDQYSSKYRSNGNYMEYLDSDEDLSTRAKDVLHGRRASNRTRDPDSPTNHVTGDRVGSGHSDTADRMSSGSSRTSSGRRHVNVRDPSPTLFDDFGLSDLPAKSAKNPFTSKAQVHRPTSNESRNITTQGAKRLSKFCYECGTKYPVSNAKFCCECGMKRLYIES